MNDLTICTIFWGLVASLGLGIYLGRIIGRDEWTKEKGLMERSIAARVLAKGRKYGKTNKAWEVITKGTDTNAGAYDGGPKPVSEF